MRLYLWLTGLGLLGQVAAAAPFLPADDDEVLARVPVDSSSLRARSAALAAGRGDLDQAVDLAWQSIARGRSEDDPRFYGYAQAALARWWWSPAPPPEVLLLRATLYQNRHAFDASLADLDKLLKRRPRDARAWLTQAVIHTVRGQPRRALRSCLALARVTRSATAQVCAGAALSVGGGAERALALLDSALNRAGAMSADERRWALVVAAETAARLGLSEQAETRFGAALSLPGRDVHLLKTYSDFLLDQRRPHEVVALLRDQTRSDALLLRLALAEQRIGAATLGARIALLQDRYREAGRRGSDGHLGDRARLSLQLLGRADDALRLALQNWARQREPGDARLVLAAALAAGAAAAAQPVLDWMRHTGIQDRTLTALGARLRQSS